MVQLLYPSMTTGKEVYMIGLFPSAYITFAIHMGFPGGSDGKESACNAGDPGSISGSRSSLEKGMATHSSFLA